MEIVRSIFRLILAKRRICQGRNVRKRTVPCGDVGM